MNIVLLLSVVSVSLFFIKTNDAQVISYLVKQISNSLPQFLNYNQNTNSNQQYINRELESSSSSNCNTYFSYDREYSGTFGKVSVPAWNPQKSVVKAIFTVGSRTPQGDYGEISLLRSKEDTLYDITNGSPLLLRVRFPVQEPLARITELYYNDRLICSEPKVVAQFVTTLTLSFTFTTNLQANSAIQPVQESQNSYRPPPPQPPIIYQTYTPPTTQQPFYQTQPTTQRVTYTQRTTNTYRTTRTFRTTTETTTPRPYVNVDNDLDNECGKSEYRHDDTTGLIVGGNAAGRGQFPWLVAYFYNGKQDNEFICGGSLISSRLVVTAAHCVSAKFGNPPPRRAQDSTFYIGKTNLDSLVGEHNYVTSVASQLIIHPDWRTTDISYDSDIAIAVLVKTVIFNKFIKPICIWKETTSYHDIIEDIGTVAGWGKTEFNSISTSSPLYTNIPVVSTEDCIYSNNKLVKITSPKTFCAGITNSNRGPCNGDSGGAFIVKNNDKSYLRGIISSAIFDSAKQTCDNNNYAVFTDVAKFTPWIEEYISLYSY